MYVSIARISFSSFSIEYDQRALRALCEKIKSRFKVCAKAMNKSETQAPSIVISMLEKTRQQIDQKLDNIAAICEESGLGRIENEEAIYDHIDNFFDQEF